MKNSNSRDKNGRAQVPPPPINSEKLMKTQVRQPKKEQLEKTNYQRPASGRKLQSTKVLPPKGTAPKKQYVIEDNMTESKIYQAKQGLQLIKKKMSAKGLSRQKVSTPSQIPEQKPISQKTLVSSKNQDTQYYQNRNNNMPPKRMQKKNTIEQNLQQKPSSNKITSNKNLNDVKITPQNQRKQPPPRFQEYRDQQMQIPIKPKKDFNALLQEQLRKQKQGQAPIKSTAPKAKTNHLSQYPQEVNLNLVNCRHCDRKFAETAIQKHQNICLKVFLSKRKAFDSAAHRAPEVEGIQQIKVQSKKPQKVQPPKNQKKQAPPSKKQQQALPKWKAASLAFRANLKQAKGATLTAQQKKASDIAQGMVQCNYCGRKFNQNAAARHIPFCQTKSKQLPKTNTRKK